MATVKGIGSNLPIPIVFEQTSVTRHVALTGTAGGIQIPDQSLFPPNELEFYPLAFPGITPQTPAVIFFRTRHTGTPSFGVMLNDSDVLQYTFTNADPSERTWHHIFLPTPDSVQLMADGNDLMFTVDTQNNTDNIMFGDVVIFYTSSELTINTTFVIPPSSTVKQP